MSCHAIAVVLSASGGVTELGGLLMVFREIAADRTRGRRLLAKLDVAPPPQRTYPLPASELQLKLRYTYEGERRMLERIPRLEADIQKAIVGLKKATDTELDEAIQRVLTDIAARDAELRDGLRYVLAGSTRNRAVGTSLLVLGLVLATGGSVLGNLCR
jgi:hypothetical protein